MAKAPKKRTTKSTAKAKPKAKPKAPVKKKTNPMGGLDDPDDTMRIRKISNGYIVLESWSEGTGANRRYRERETFTKVKPKVIVTK